MEFDWSHGMSCFAVWVWPVFHTTLLQESPEGGLIGGSGLRLMRLTEFSELRLKNVFPLLLCAEVTRGG